MTVGELIEKLSAFDPGMRAVTPGFDEAGYDDVGEPRVVRVVVGAGGHAHCGRHADPEPGLDPGVEAVLLNFS